MTDALGDGTGLTLADVGLSQYSTAGAIFVGSTVSYILYGLATCQVLTYFWNFPADPTSLKAHVAIVWLMETVNVFLMTPAIWFYLIRRGADMSFQQFVFCNDWTLMAQSVPTELCGLLVEVFFIIRMWRIADSKPIAMFTTIPFLSGWGFNVAYAVGMFRLRCFPDFKVNDRWLFSSYGSRIVSDGLIAGTMCYMLWKKRPDALWQTKTLRMISYVAFWSLTTGVLMWMSAVAFIVSYLVVPATLIPPSVYLLRGRIHSNTMLAVLNSRQKIRKMVNETIPLQDRPSQSHRRQASGPTKVSLPHTDDNVYRRHLSSD